MAAQIQLHKNVTFCSLCLPLAAIFLTGCFTDDLNERLKALEKQSDQWRQLAKTTSEMAIRAVPGERYLQLIDDLNNTKNPEKRQAAQEFLKSLGHFDPAASYVVSVAYGFDDSSPLHSDIFLAFDGQREHVVYYAPNFHEDQSVTSGIPLPNTRQDIDKTVDEKVDQIVQAMTGDPRFINLPPGTNLTNTALPELQALDWPGSLTPNFFVSGSPNVNQAITLFQQLNSAKIAAQARQNQVRQLLKEAIKAQYAPKSLPVGSAVLTRQWIPASSQDYVFVLIPEEDFQKHKNDKNFKVSAVLHKEGDLSATFNYTNPISFTKAAFEGNEPVERPFNQGKVRWAARNITGGAMVLPQDVERIKQWRMALAEINKLDSQPQVPIPAVPKKPWYKF